MAYCVGGVVWVSIRQQRQINGGAFRGHVRVERRGGHNIRSWSIGCVWFVGWLVSWLMLRQKHNS